MNEMIRLLFHISFIHLFITVFEKWNFHPVAKDVFDMGKKINLGKFWGKIPLGENNDNMVLIS